MTRVGTEDVSDQYHMLQTILRLTDLGVWQWWPQQKRFLADQRLQAILHMSDEQIANFTFEEWVSRLHEADRELVLQRREHGGQTGYFDSVYRFRCGDNQWRWVHDRSTVFESGPDGSPTRLLGVVEDITSRQDQFRTWKRLERALPGVLYSLVTDSGQLIRYSFMTGHTITYFGVTPEQIYQDARSVLLAIHDDDLPHVLATRHKAALSQQDQSCEYRLKTPTGLEWVEDRISPDLDPDGRTILHGVIVQITERKALEDKLTRLSNTDELTGLYNRRYLRSSLENETIRYQATGQPFSVVVLDLDSFKQLNDEHGHLQGDAVLSQLADLLRSQLRATDIAGRTGGEEFLLVLPDTDQEEAFRMTECIRQALSEITFEDASGNRFSVTLSAGIATAQGHLRAYETIWNQADKALYQAKKSGRNRVCQEHINPASPPPYGPSAP